MVNNNNILEVKLQAVFLQLKSFSKYPIKDDTILQKLQTDIHKLIQLKENQLVWSNYSGLVSFISDVLALEFLENEDNQAVVVCALYCFASLLQKEENFFFLLHHESFKNFLQALPKIREKLSLTAAALDVVSNMIDHPSGFDAVKTNDIWEQLLLASLKSQSIFVQKKCVKVINSFLLKTEDQKVFSDCVHDLELILYKFRESKLNLTLAFNECEAEDPRRLSLSNSVNLMKFNINTVLLVFYEMLLQTLGKRSLYSKLKPTLDLTSKILFRFNFDINSDIVIKLCRMLLLSTLHRFQDQILKFGTAEQFHLDSVISDILSLSRHMLSKGHIKELISASFDLHVYWHKMCTNLREQHNAELSKCQSILFVILRFQKIPLLVVCDFSVGSTNEDERRKLKEGMDAWNTLTFSQMSIREEQKNEMKRLEKLIEDHLKKDVKETGRLCTSCLSSFASVIDYLHPKCAIAIFQGIMLLLRFQLKLSNAIVYDQKLYHVAIDTLRSLIVKYHINWTKSFEANSILTVLCSIVWVSGMNTRVKVSTLKTFMVCIERFIPPVMVTLIDSEKVDDCNLEKMGKTLTVYLSDTEWEVRDSALELLHVCMTIAKEKYPYFVDWFLRHNLLPVVFQAVGDVEPYVQASALDVLSALVNIEALWSLLETQSLKPISLRAVTYCGDTCIRKAGVALLSALFSSGKFNENELKMVVGPVIQNATNDPDDEVRLAAVRFISKNIDKDFSTMGMVDGEFPSVTFHRGKIIKLESEEVKRRALSVVTRMCSEGYFTSLLQCSKDSSSAVSREAIEQMKCVDEIMKKYDIQLPTDLKDFSRIPPRSDVIDSPSPQGASGEINSSKDEDIDKGIDFVVNKTDRDIISKIDNDCFSSSALLWHSRRPFEASETPPNFPPITTRKFNIQMSNMLSSSTTPSLTSSNKRFEVEVLNLLDDILLDPDSTSGQNEESRSLDCY